MADPFTLAAIGATVGAVTNKDDPLKGALIGGLGGYAGGAMLGAGAVGAAAPGTLVGAGGLGGAAGSGLTATTLGGGVGAGAGLGTASGGITGLTAGAAPAAYGLGAPIGTAMGSGVTGLAAAAEPAMLASSGGLGATFGAMSPMQQYMALNVAGGLLGGQQQPQGGTVTTQAVPRGQYQPVMTPQSLLATQMDMRRRQPYSFA